MPALRYLEPYRRAFHVATNVAVASAVLECAEIGTVEEPYIRGVAGEPDLDHSPSGLLAQIPEVEVHLESSAEHLCLLSYTGVILS
jgi:hypothetical protein